MKPHNKTVSQVLAIAIFKFLLPQMINAGIPLLKQEAFVNDIPFDTRQVVADYRFEKVMALIPRMQESDTNDIPFNTQEVLLHSCSKISKLLHPWSLNDYFVSLASKPTRQRAGLGFPVILLKSFKLQPEPEANDIPFDTRIIFAKIIAQREHAAEQIAGEHHDETPPVSLFDSPGYILAVVLGVLILGVLLYSVYGVKKS